VSLALEVLPLSKTFLCDDVLSRDSCAHKAVRVFKKIVNIASLHPSRVEMEEGIE
jgi:hypothetical protein